MQNMSLGYEEVFASTCYRVLNGSLPLDLRRFDGS
jgi:hypothetical protein